MVVEGRRWLDDAFACGGDADERTRALALTGRGLLDFLAGAIEHCDDDLATALEIFERHDDVESMALAHSFYAEQAAVRGDLDEARRRRLVVLDFYGESPEEPFAVAARSYSLAKLAILDGDLEAAERHYRAATEGFGRLDRPVMNSMCLGMVADFDERAGDYPAAIKTLEAAIETNESLLGGLHRIAAGPPRLGAAPRRSAGASRGGLPAGARLGPPRAPHDGDLPGPGRVGRAAPAPRTGRRRRRGRHRGAGAATGPTASAGSGTASTPRPTCRPPPRCAARCSPRSPPNGTNRNGRRRCSGRPTACGPSRASRCRRSSTTT